MKSNSRNPGTERSEMRRQEAEVREGCAGI